MMSLPPNEKSSDSLFCQIRVSLEGSGCCTLYIDRIPSGRIHAVSQDDMDDCFSKDAADCFLLLLFFWGKRGIDV